MSHYSKELPQLFQLMINIISTELIGKCYDPLRIATCFFILGGLIHKNVIDVNGVHTDTRQSFIVAIESGWGKSIIKHFVEKSLQEIAIVRTPSVPWPEQLIGKSVIRKQKDHDIIIPKLGYFSYSFIVIDECSKWFRRSDRIAQDLWSNVRLALDTYGRNWIEKERTGDLPKEALRYKAECSMMNFMQPTPILRDYVEDGTLRRFLPIIVDVPAKEKERVVMERGRLVPTAREDLDHLREMLQLLSEITIEWEFTDEAVDDIARKTLRLARNATTHSSPVVRNWGEHMHGTIQNRLYGMAAIIAAASYVYGKSRKDLETVGPSFDTQLTAKMTITPAHTHLAYHILNSLFESALVCLERLVIPGSESESTKSRSVRLLKILKRWGCTDESESTKSISEYETEIAKVLMCSPSNARRIWTQLKENGLVDSKQVGSHDSRVWLTSRGLADLESDPQLP